MGNTNNPEAYSDNLGLNIMRMGGMKVSPKIAQSHIGILQLPNSMWEMLRLEEMNFFL